jgi:uncharacterized damage-inducible protein DinB
MEIQHIDSFLIYFSKIHQRTMRVVRCIPADMLEWTYREGKFTLGDQVRHIATINRYMFIETVSGRPSRYAGCGREFADGYDQILQFAETLHAETVELLSFLTDADLQHKCTTPDGAPIAIWKWLRAMVEHEIHHRGQIYLYLSLLQVPTPPLYGLTSEQVRDRSIAG